MIPLDPFGLSPAQYSAAAEWLAFLTLLATLGVVSRQLRLAAATRRDQTRPYVVPYVEIRQGSVAMIRVENLGSTPAYDVRLSFVSDPPVSVAGSIRWVDRGAWSESGLPLVVPGQQMDYFLDVLPKRFEAQSADSSIGMSWEVRVSYRDATGQKFEGEMFLLDLMPLEGVLVPRDPQEVIAREVGKIARAAGQWTSSRGLHVNVRDASQAAEREARSMDWERAVELWSSGERRRAVRLVADGILHRQGFKRWGD